MLAEIRTSPVLNFPDWEIRPAYLFSPHPEIVSQQLSTLHRMPTLNQGVVVVPVQTLMQRLAPLSYVVGNTFDTRVGQTLDLDAEKRRLTAARYSNVPQVLDTADFPARRAQLDAYPMGPATQSRIALSAVVIDHMRGFHPRRHRHPPPT